MRVFVVGSNDWIDYNTVMRTLTVVIEDANFNNPNDKTITFIHRGLPGAENMVTEYVGKVKKFMREKGYIVNEKIVNKSDSDFDIINSGIDKALIFKGNNGKRCDYCAKILAALEIPTKLTRG